MHRADLINGVALLYTSDLQGNVIIQYPDGSQVRTTWGQLSQIESLVSNLRQAYECLLKRAAEDDHLPVEALIQIDDLLHSVTRFSKPTKPIRN